MQWINYSFLFYILFIIFLYSTSSQYNGIFKSLLQKVLFQNIHFVSRQFYAPLNMHFSYILVFRKYHSVSNCIPFCAILRWQTLTLFRNEIASPSFLDKLSKAPTLSIFLEKSQELYNYIKQNQRHMQLTTKNYLNLIEFN